MDFRQTIENYDIYKRNKITFWLLFTLKSPLSHIGSVVGNTANLNTIGSIDPEGNSCEPFVYSGNAIRGNILRRVGIKNALTTLGIKVDPNTHATLFSGGRIDGATANDMDLDTKIRKLMPWLSVIGTAKPSKVFGSGTAQMINGRIKIGNAYLICYETARKIPSRFLPLRAAKAINTIVEAERAFEKQRFPEPHTDLYIDGNYQQQQMIERAYKQLEALRLEQNEALRNELKSWFEYMTTQQKVRQDSLKDANLVSCLIGTDKQLASAQEEKAAKPIVETPLATNDSLFAEDLFGNVAQAEKKTKAKPAPKVEKKTEAKDEVEKKKSDQMIMNDRLIRDGAQLLSRWDFEGTSVEEGYIYDCLHEFSKSPYLGGKSNTGCGLVDLEIFFNDHNTKESGRLFCASNQLIETTERFNQQHHRYKEFLGEYSGYLDENSSEIKGFLGA